MRFRLNSGARASSGVTPARLTPTPFFLIASAALTVILSSVGCPGRRLHLRLRQRAASAAFSVALGRIAADVLAGSGR
jgi:hypothetical protein